jgi:transcriptional regulator with XRE-family HTH domain
MMESSVPLAQRFGRNVWRSRRRADLTQDELGGLTELSRVDIGAVERGERLPRLDTILKLAAGTETSTCALLEGLRWRPGYYVEGTFNIEDEAKPSADRGRAAG